VLVKGEAMVMKEDKALSMVMMDEALTQEEAAGSNCF
jgi:hypothetical protein